MTDILLDTSGEIDFTGGDIHWGESTRQHQEDILMANVGEYKTAPTSTVGIVNFLKDDNDQDILREIRVKFSKDGMAINALSLTGTKLDIDANYRN